MLYAPPPTLWPTRIARDLKREVYAALTGKLIAPFVTPEIWLLITLDVPEINDLALLQGLKLVKLCWGMEDFHCLVEQPDGTTHLSGAIKSAIKRGFLFYPEGISCIGLDTTLSWETPMKDWVVQVKKFLAEIALNTVSTRRPSHFHGACSVDWRAMRKTWRTYGPWQQGVLLRLWSGGIILRQRIFTAEAHDPEVLCDCREAMQIVQHVVWPCPLTRHLWREQHAWAFLLDNAWNISWLLPSDRAKDYLQKWKQALDAVISIVKFFEVEKEPHRQEDVVDNSGHDLKWDHTVQRYWCASCLLSRPHGTLGWMLRKHCQGLQRGLRPGDAKEWGGHRLILQWYRSKRQKLGWVCLFCGVVSKMADALEMERIPCTQV
eukprot:4887574-Amphidinium_carterae.1